ncbi:MAG: oleate hydratase, partial [Arenicellales bacterium]
MMQEGNRSHSDNTKVYLVGSGIASLASATYLINDAGMAGDHIHILEQDDNAGGALDRAGDPDNG